MNRFLQLHLLTSYPPSNLNRDDLGRPKTAVMGGALRLRVSSQSLKRAWRTSEVFENALGGHVGIRTKEMGVEVYQQLLDKGIEEKSAREWAKAIAGVFGKLKNPKKESKKDKDADAKPRRHEMTEDLEIEQLAHFSPEEHAAIEALVEKLASTRQAPDEADLDLLRHRHSAADIALFGRMLAASATYNTEAAAQVAHAISVHKVQVEDDYFTAVDDINSKRKDKEDVGAGHLGETEFGAAVYYLYVCINRELLEENLGGDRALADKTLAALLECAATIPPGGKQNSFASRAYASYILAEKGDQQPRSLAVAFLRPVGEERDEYRDVLGSAIQRLEDKRANMEKVYGPCASAHRAMNAETGEGSLAALKDFVTTE